MELDYWLFKNKVKHKEFAKKVGIMPHRLSLIVNKKATPSLLTAIAIHEHTNGQVSYKEMVKLEDRKWV